jgi:hypothetical protein
MRKGRRGWRGGWLEERGGSWMNERRMDGRNDQSLVRREVGSDLAPQHAALHHNQPKKPRNILEKVNRVLCVVCCVSNVASPRRGGVDALLAMSTAHAGGSGGQRGVKSLDGDIRQQGEGLVQVGPLFRAVCSSWFMWLAPTSGEETLLQSNQLVVVVPDKEMRNVAVLLTPLLGFVFAYLGLSCCWFGGALSFLTSGREHERSGPYGVVECLGSVLGTDRPCCPTRGRGTSLGRPGLRVSKTGGHTTQFVSCVRRMEENERVNKRHGGAYLLHPLVQTLKRLGAENHVNGD